MNYKQHKVIFYVCMQHVVVRIREYIILYLLSVLCTPIHYTMYQRFVVPVLCIILAVAGFVLIALPVHFGEFVTDYVYQTAKS